MQHEPPSSYGLAVSVLQNCAEKLGPLVQSFLISSIEDKDSEGSELKAFYHDIIFEIFKCAPQMLLAVIPNLTQELLVRGYFFIKLTLIDALYLDGSYYCCCYRCYYYLVKGDGSYLSTCFEDCLFT